MLFALPVPAAVPAAAVDVRVDHVQAVPEVSAPVRAVEGSAVAALAPAEPQSPDPAPAPAMPDVPPDLLDYAARLATMAVEPMVMTPEQASTFVAGEVRKWKTVAAAAKIQVD